MPYRFAKQRIVWWPIAVMSAVDGGQREEQGIQLKLKLLDAADLKGADAASTLEKKLADTGLTKAIASLAKLRTGDKDRETREFLAQHVLDWKDVLDETGDVISFSLDNLMACMEDLAFSRAVAEALSQASYGGVARKN